MKYSVPKGLFDILPYEFEERWRSTSLWHYLESILHPLASDYGFLEIRTPIFENSELFDRGIGETSDIVSKEMYTFPDRKGRLLSLRPEGTAAVMRAFVEKGLHTLKKVHKLYYMGPMFRYERPQSGRYRQHHQFGVEVIGSKSPAQDVEVIELLLEIYRRIGLKNFNLKINSVGDEASRNRFKTALKEYLRPHLSELSGDSQNRFEKNPLRILDSKDAKDKEILEKAPSILNFLSDEARLDFQMVQMFLKELNIPYLVDEKLVRGLDYYNKTVFEVTSSSLGAQNALGGGGRYDGLMKNFGGPDLPSVGFAMGLERVIQTLLAEGICPPARKPSFIYFLPLEDSAMPICLRLATELRHRSITAVVDFDKQKLKNSLQEADQALFSYAAILGGDELAKGQLLIRDLKNKRQWEVDLSSALSKIIDLHSS